VTGSVTSRQALRWLIPTACALAAVAIQKAFNFEPPHWSRWISIAVYAVLGVAALAFARNMPGTRPAFARTIGACFLIIAVLGTCYQLTSN
jgi:hypothetical protein